MLNASCRTIPAALVGVAVAAAISILPYEVRAEKAISISTLRETIESAHVSGVGSNGVAISKPHGTVTLRKQGIKQIFQVDVRNLGEDDLGVWLDESPVFVTNSMQLLLCQLDRKSASTGHWVVQLVGLSQPPSFVATNLLDLTDLEGRILNVGYPSGDETNRVVRTLLWAPIPPLVSRPSAGSFSKRSLLTPPVPPLITGQQSVPAPKARGKINLRYSGTSGRSFIEVDAKKLLGGHSYWVWMTLTTTNDVAYPACITNSVSSCLTNIAQLTLSLSGKNSRYVRDTRGGDSLPLQFEYAGDLSNRLILIQDELEITYLQGVIP